MYYRNQFLILSICIAHQLIVLRNVEGHQTSLQRSGAIGQRLQHRASRPIDSADGGNQKVNEGVTVTIDGRSTNQHVKLESIITVLDRVVYTITRPANIFNLVRFALLALSTIVMSTIVFPLADLSKPRTSRHNSLGIETTSHTGTGRIGGLDIEGIIELVTKLYEERSKPRSSYRERGLCRERSLCIIGDMMACDFPSIVTTLTRFIQHQPSHLDSYKNKYTKAFILGLNQTNCEKVFNIESADCPTILDYVKSYLQSYSRRRRDQQHWRRQYKEL